MISTFTIYSVSIYALGYQRARTFNLVSDHVLNPFHCTFPSPSSRRSGCMFYSFDHYLLSFTKKYYQFHSFPHHYPYPLDMNRYLILPLWSQFKSVVLPFDVIHCLGFHSSGTKPDAIPGRIHLASTIRLLTKGQHIGFCYESCGQGHTSTIILSRIL